MPEAMGVVCSTGEREELAESGSFDAFRWDLCEAVLPGDLVGASMQQLVIYSPASRFIHLRKETLRSLWSTQCFQPQTALEWEVSSHGHFEWLAIDSKSAFDASRRSRI
jgi:hypothetical protein